MSANLTRRQKAKLNNTQSQEERDKARLDQYEECGEFIHEKLAGDFDASRNRMQRLKQSMIVEAEAMFITDPNGKSPAGGTYRNRYKVALSKFKEMDKRENAMVVLLKRSEENNPDLDEEEWKLLRFEMNWLIGVRESYDEWDWKIHGTQR